MRLLAHERLHILMLCLQAMRPWLHADKAHQAQLQNRALMLAWTSNQVVQVVHHLPEYVRSRLQGLPR